MNIIYFWFRCLTLKFFDFMFFFVLKFDNKFDRKNFTHERKKSNTQKQITAMASKCSLTLTLRLKFTFFFYFYYTLFGCFFLFTIVFLLKNTSNKRKKNKKINKPFIKINENQTKSRNTRRMHTDFVIFFSPFHICTFDNKRYPNRLH